ncbi:transporter [Methylobacterium sp. ARG-1]|uniref:transporter n=1 Tax=Methylobacterium sp. ARG-1 TaxID=1692501 RepID=UPI00068014D1|nr:transporter [Methylobacterium sp. ARG-1]KNY22855.1 CoxB-like protein [Methylobacterium sp. ARG-1]
MTTAGLIRAIQISTIAASATYGLVGGPAQAGSSAQPGQTVGQAPGAPLPIGLYFIDTSSFGSRDITPRRTDSSVNLPSFIWATPAEVIGGRLQLVVLQPITASSTRGAAYQSGFGQTLLAAQAAWKLGNNLNFSYLLGAYLPSETKIVIQNPVLHQRFAITFNGDGWNLTGNFLYGTFFDTRSASGTFYPDFLNLDLTATKHFGKWEIGPVAFGSTDLPTNNPSYARQGQFAVGGLVGYNFGPVNLQAYVTRDVVQRNYAGLETRGWLRATVPIYQDKGGPPEPSPILRKF